MDAFQALVEPRRREILRLVRSDEMKAGDIAGHFSVTRPAVSQHIKVLLDADLLEVRREGTVRFYRANPRGLLQMKTFLDDFWSSGLRELKAAVERDLKKKPGRRPGS